MEHQTGCQNAVVAVFTRQQDAENAVRKLASIGIPKDSVIEYEQAVKTDGFRVVAHGSADEMARSKAILEASNPTRIDLRENVKAQVSDPVQVADKLEEARSMR